jgi:CRISPR/Cas system-associated endonuclease Cas3-HD
MFMPTDNDQDPAEVPKEEEEWVDITSMMDAAANSLSVTEPMLCNKNSFNLQDAMSALEIMDKKMDCCEIPASQVAPFGVKADENKMVFPRPAPTGLDDVVDPLPWDGLTLLDAAHVTIQNLVRLESLIAGASVVESTFTSLYAHKPVMVDMKARLEALSLTEQIQAIMKPKPRGSIPQHVVFASTLIMLELTDTVRSIILNADIYEEEDFTVSTYNIQQFQDRDETIAVNVVGNVLEMMVSELDDTTKSSDEVAVVGLILKFQLDFLQMCTTLARLTGRVVRDNVQKAQAVARESATTLERISKFVSKLEETKPDSVNALIKKTFDSHVNRPLVGNAPVRKVMFREPKESIGTFTVIVKDIDEAFCRLILKGNNLDRIRSILANISISNVNILVRSLIVLNLYFDDQIFGHHSLPVLIAKNMQQLLNLPSTVFDNQYSEAFLNRMAKPMYDILKVLVLNRNRQRSYIEAVMFHEWSTLFREAQIVDATYKKQNPDVPPYFSLYILSIAIHLMDHFVALGIELNLFCGEHEITVAYWYRDFLLSSLISQISTMRQIKIGRKQVERQAAELKTKQQRGKKKGSKQHKKNINSTKAQSLVNTQEDMEEEFNFNLLNLKRGLCRGIVRVSSI